METNFYSEESIARRTADGIERNARFEHDILSTVRNAPFEIPNGIRKEPISDMLKKHDELLRELHFSGEDKKTLGSVLYLMGAENSSESDSLFDEAVDTVAVPAVARDFLADPFFRNIDLFGLKTGNYELIADTVKANSLWFDGMRADEAMNRPGTPKFVRYDKDLRIPCLVKRENKTEIKSYVTPFMIRQVKKAVENLQGDVLVFGAGLGYFAFAAAQKKNVTSVTVVDNDEDMIEFFKRNLRPQFPNCDKIMAFTDDMIEYAKDAFRKDYSFCYVDMFPGRENGFCDALALEGVLASKNIRHMNYYSDMILYYSAYETYLRLAENLGKEEREKRISYINAILGESAYDLLNRVERRNQSKLLDLRRKVLSRDAFATELLGKSYVRMGKTFA